MSKLRCWPNCLAIFVRSRAGNEGRVVTCVRLADDSELGGYTRRDGPVWIIDRELQTNTGEAVQFAQDAFLAPLTPPPNSESTDTTEVIEGNGWLTVPVGEGAAA